MNAYDLIIPTKTADVSGNVDSKTDKPKPVVPPYFDITFKLAYAILIAASFFTFYGAVAVKSTGPRTVLILECIISSIACTIYYFMSNAVHGKVASGEPIEWSDVVQLRYLDWSFTTPLLLVSLCLILGAGAAIKVAVLAAVVVLDLIMLYIGYLGETGKWSKSVACILGFIPMFGVFFILYTAYLAKSSAKMNKLVFWMYVILWSGYGAAYLLDDVTKNTAMNLLDSVAKGAIGIGLTANYLKLV